MSEINDYCNLKEVEWVHIPSGDFIMKYKFFHDRYLILITNLREIFGENLNENEVQCRFSDLNEHAKMKTSVIMRNLEKSLDASLNGSNSLFKLTCLENSIKIHMQFNVNRASLSFNFEPCLLSMHELRSHILVPTLSHAFLTYQENISLKKRIRHLESLVKSETLSKDSSLDLKKISSTLSLTSNPNVSDAAVVDLFMNVHKDIQACFSERQKTFDLLKNHSPESCDKSETPVKKEVSETSLQIQFDEDKIENVKEDRKDPNLLQLPLKREISETLSESPNIVQACNQAPSSLNVERTKKKKSFKF